MTLSAAQLHALMPEFSALVRGIVRKVHCRNALCFVLEIRTPGQNHRLLFDLAPQLVRAHFVTAKRPQPPRPAAFVMLLRKYLVGAVVTAVSQVNDDRLLRLDFEGWMPTEETDSTPKPTPNDPVPAPSHKPPKTGRSARFVLMAELTPRFGNIFLLGHHLPHKPEVVMGSLRVSRSTQRPMVVGDPYQTPPPPPTKVSQHTKRDPLALLALEPNGARSQQLELLYTHRASQQGAHRLAIDLLRQIRTQRKTFERRVKAVERDLARAEEAAKFRRLGELLQTAYGNVERGASEVRVPDYYQDGQPMVSVPIDPAMDLQTNIARYFRRYRKYKNAEETILERLDAAEQRRDTLRNAEQKALHLAWFATEHKVGQLSHQEAPDPKEGQELPPNPTASEALEALQKHAETLYAQQLLPTRANSSTTQTKTKGPQRTKAQPYRTFQSNKGRPIFVGKGGRDNDKLSLHVARGNDLWLHAHNWAGAHVVVRLHRGEEIDHETLLDAATLAVHYSKGKRDTTVEVLYTHAKYIRKPKGFPPGRVTVAGGKTIAIQLESKRLERLLQSRPK